MNENIESETPSSIHEITEAGREKLSSLQQKAEDTLPAAASYLQSHPWLIAVGALALGSAVFAVSQGFHRESRSEAFRRWLNEAVSRVPQPKPTFASRILGVLGKKGNLFS